MKLGYLLLSCLILIACDRKPETSTSKPTDDSEAVVKYPIVRQNAADAAEFFAALSRSNHVQLEAAVSANVLTLHLDGPSAVQDVSKAIGKMPFRSPVMPKGLRYGPNQLWIEVQGRKPGNDTFTLTTGVFECDNAPAVILSLSQKYMRR